MQGGFFAADVGAGAELDPDVEVETLDPGDGFSQNLLLPEFLENVLKAGFEVGVFGPKVEDPQFRADGVPRDGHALEEEPRQLGQDDPVLEGPGFAFVSVADDEVRRRSFPYGKTPT